MRQVVNGKYGAIKMPGKPGIFYSDYLKYI